MLPQGGITRNTASQDVKQQPSRTYGIVGGRVVGMIDGHEAMKQSIFKALQTSRFEHNIYSGNYGNQLSEALGSDPSLAKSIVTRRIKEALLVDDRIRAINDVMITSSGDVLTVSFSVDTQFGVIPVVQEVR